MKTLNLQQFCRMFRSWCLLTHPEKDIDEYINEFERDFEQFVLFYNSLVQ